MVGWVPIPHCYKFYCRTLPATQTSWSRCSYPHLCPPSRSTCNTPVTPISLQTHDQAKPRFSVHVPLFLPPRILFPAFSTWQTYSSPQTSAQYFVFLGEFLLTVSFDSPELRHFLHCLHVVGTARCPLNSILPFLNAKGVVTRHMAAQPEMSFPAPPCSFV